LALWNAYHDNKKTEWRLLDDFSSLRPSLSDLDGLLLSLYATVSANTLESLGRFVSLGYQSLPETVIRYTLETPRLNNIGYNLCGKHLIIDGSVGAKAGWKMVGRLTINGTVGARTGYSVYGVIDDTPAVNPAVLSDHGLFPSIGHYHIGCRKGVWNLPEESRSQFLEDIMLSPQPNITHDAWYAHFFWYWESRLGFWREP
jgi:hypothetical protein